MYHFIINPNAGSGRGWKVWRAIAGYMDRHNIEYEAVLTNGTGEAREASRELTKKAGKPCFLIAGKSCAVSEKAALPKALLRDRLRRSFLWKRRTISQAVFS